MRISVLAAACLIVPSFGAFAEGQAVGIKVGALGVGVEYTYELNDRVAFRGGLNGAQISLDGDEGGIDYHFGVIWDSLSVAVDFHPIKTAFRVTGGLLRNDNGLSAVSTPTGNITVGDTTYTPSEVGVLTGEIVFDRTSKFIGVGWDWSRGKRLFGTSFDMGLLDQGKPKVRLAASGTLLGDPSFEQDLAAEQTDLASSLRDLDLIPYVSVGFNFRF
jgi:hypothetical protein